MLKSPIIVAPVCSERDAQEAVSAGAGELYCGAMFDDWVNRFGDADLLTRRQGRAAHVRSREDLGSIVQVAQAAGCPVALTINARYSRELEPQVLALAHLWEELGGQSVVVSDLGLLLALHQTGSRLKRHLSVLAGVYNSNSAVFFEQLGVSRIVLPRDLDGDEIGDLVAGAPACEFEALVMNQKCTFMDGFCGFYHGTRLPTDVPAEFDYVSEPACAMPVVWAHDPAYEGHGCQLHWRTEQGPVNLVRRYEDSCPPCAACFLKELGRSGVRFLKIAGRSYPPDMIGRAIRFIRQAYDICNNSDDAGGPRAEVRRLYAATFGECCDNTRCYYRWSKLIG